MKTKTAIMKWTLVRHSAFEYKGDPCFRMAVQVETLTNPKDVERVTKVGGLLFDQYKQASDAEYAANYPDEAMGLIPRCRGSFSTRSIDGLSIYVPPAKEGAKP